MTKCQYFVNGISFVLFPAVLDTSYAGFDFVDNNIKNNKNHDQTIGRQSCDRAESG